MKMFTTPRLVAIALCAALNFAIGNIVYLVKLPIYLDSIGTILCALLIFPDRRAAFACASVAGFIGVILSGLVLNPFLPWFMFTMLAIAAVSALLTARATATFRARPLPVPAFAANVVIYGVLTGLASAVVSAPVVVWLFGGVTGSGSAFVVAFFLKTGEQLLNSALYAGLTTEPIDKTLQVLLAALLYRATPREFIAMLAPPVPSSAT
jgi:energy-coupling factor transport system substrate-specific component